jgi:hypothetical protein
MAEEVQATEDKKLLRRAPALICKISQLSADLGRVCVLGTVVQKNSEIGSIVIDDGESSVLVLLNNPADIEKIKEGTTVRVFAKVWGSEDEIELQAEIVQDFSRVDRELYNKVMFG